MEVQTEELVYTIIERTTNSAKTCFVFTCSIAQEVYAKYWFQGPKFHIAHFFTSLLESPDITCIITHTLDVFSNTVQISYIYSRPKIGDDGTVDLKAKDMSLSQTVSVRNDGSGRLVVLAADCSFDVRKISVKFHGGARSVNTRGATLHATLVSLTLHHDTTCGPGVAFNARATCCVEVE